MKDDETEGRIESEGRRGARDLSPDSPEYTVLL